MSEPNDAGRAAQPTAPRAPWWRRRVTLAAAAAAAVLIAGAIVVVRSVGGAPAGPAALPSPRVLARDPVPAGLIVRTLPKSCGVTGKTLAKVVPGASIDRDGNALEGAPPACAWSSPSTSERGSRTVTVELAVARPRFDVWPGATSPIAAAIGNFAARTRDLRPAPTPLRGLGDEAVLTSGRDAGRHDTRSLVFRAGNTVANVEYQRGTDTSGSAKDTTITAKAARAGLTRTAADVARSLGAPAAPAPAAAPPAVAPAALPGHICATVPENLRHRLIDDDAEGKASEEDPLAGMNTITAAHTTSCTWSTGSRELTAAVTIAGAGDPAATLRAVSREYLRRYYALRDERPISAHDARDFHALAGVGDQGFCSYLAESGGLNAGPRSPARCVIRTGTALVTVAYGSTPPATGSDADDHHLKPLTAREAVNGAYAVALPVLRSVRH